MPLCFETAKLFDKVIMHVCTYYKHGKTKYITFIGLEFFMPHTPQLNGSVGTKKMNWQNRI